MDILIFGGQSNMQGQTERLPEDAPVSGAWEYRHGEGKLVPLCHPVGEDFGDLLLGAHEGHGCLVPSFVRAYREIRPKEVSAIHAAKGATVIGDWRPGGKRYELALEKIRAGIELAKSRGKIEKICYIWLQGESDSLAETGEEEYLAALKEYRNALFRDVGIQCFGIIRVGYFGERERDLAIMRAQDRAAETQEFVMLTRVCSELSLDARFLNPYARGHYNNSGMELIGRLAGGAMARAAEGLWDDTK